MIVRELVDPRLGFVTVTNVDLSTEMDIAKVYVSVMGKESDISKSMAALQGASGFFQERVAKLLNTRRTPRLDFRQDDSIATAHRMDQLIRKARAEDDEAAAGREPEEAPDGE